MLVRMFGLFGVVLGLAYLNEGTAFIGLLPSQRYRGGTSPRPGYAPASPGKKNK